VRLGMGPAKTRARATQIGDRGLVVVLGVAGGLAPGVRPTDIVVASDVMVHDGQPIACHGAETLAEAMRRTGLTVHVGRIVSTPRIVTGDAFDELAASSGGLAVDMESGYLAEELPRGRPIVVVRAVSDTKDEPLFSPAILRRGAAALSALRRAAAVIPQWAVERSDATTTPSLDNEGMS
jgi:4-hydroxy-3-methylbut-2-en-1-yl diphosphate reductase